METQTSCHILPLSAYIELNAKNITAIMDDYIRNESLPQQLRGRRIVGEASFAQQRGGGGTSNARDDPLVWEEIGDCSMCLFYQHAPNLGYLEQPFMRTTKCRL
jgi:hypothetical protein